MPLSAADSERIFGRVGRAQIRRLGAFAVLAGLHRDDRRVRVPAVPDRVRGAGPVPAYVPRLAGAMNTPCPEVVQVVRIAPGCAKRPGIAGFADCPPKLRERIRRDIAAEEKATAASRLRRELGKLAGFSDAVTPGAAPVREADRAEMARYDEMGFYGGPEPAADLSLDDRRFAFSPWGGAESVYLRHCRERTGETLSDETLKKFRRASAELLGQSLEITGKMEAEPDPDAVIELLDEMALVAASAGGCPVAVRSAFAKTARDLAVRFMVQRDASFFLWRYYVHSREVEKLPNFRRILFIPYVAQAVRAPMLSALEYWLSRNLHARFWTFTSGVRVQLSGVRDRADWLHRKLSKLNDEKFMKDAGVRMVFRSTELGTPETDERGNVLSNAGEIEVDANGQTWFHVHAHCVMELAHGYIPPVPWSALLAKVGKFWPFWWGEGGEIRNARECCKYLCKPGSLLKLSGADLVALYVQLRQMKLCHPMGSLAEEIAHREDPEVRERLVKVRSPDGPIWKVVKNWNRHARRTRIEAAQDAAGRLTAKAARPCIVLVARSVPGFGACGVAEPRITLMGKFWDEAAVREMLAVKRIVRQTEDEFRAGVAEVGIRVHTRSPTVREFDRLWPPGDRDKIPEPADRPQN